MHFKMGLFRRGLQDQRWLFARATGTNANMSFDQLACCGSIVEFGKYPLLSFCAKQSLQFVFIESGALYWSGCVVDKLFFLVICICKFADHTLNQTLAKPSKAFQ